QIGDPFAEKKLLECCLELLERELLVCLQDLGAAGLTSSASEMASKGGVGLDLDVALVPLREAGMAPFEVMISESQERMLCVVEPALVAELIAVCERWETLATPIGSVTDSGRLRVLDRGRAVGDLPVEVLVDDCPLYDLEPLPDDVPLYGASVVGGGGGGELARALGSPAEALLALLRSPNLASRRPVYEQYDPIVQSRTVRRPDQADAAVLALPDGSAIAVSIDGNGRRVACDPRRGAAEAVYECAANLACVGAEPLGLTNCLNFGNPEKPRVARQLIEAVEGLAEACETLGVPVVGGNVSLYNEAPSGPIFPTPVVGMVGRLPDAARAGRLGFAREGDAIALVGEFEPSLAGSELAKLAGRPPAGPLPVVKASAVRDALMAVRDGIRSGALQNAHDIAEGGVAVAIAECCIAGGLGATVELPQAIEIFGEAPGRAFVVSGPREQLGGFQIIGTVGGAELEIAGQLKLPVSSLAQAREGGLGEFL
ncbi:MAG: phosphoribosylformylglycinamidine synthase subunit PurL, partial [Solirubrobacterales bacterium]|nr:phosphoribosylformylglycinamidine synthase subunit PurL [Solirubrobacterales bacterium]